MLRLRSSKWLALALAGLCTLAIPLGIAALETPSFPGAPWASVNEGTDAGMAAATNAQVTVDGVTLRVTSVLADPEQTLFAYKVEVSASEDQFMTIAPRPRLLLSDGTLVNFISNAQDGNAQGTLAFRGLPAGVHQARLEIDGLQLRSGMLGKRFVVPVTVDNRAGSASAARSAESSTHGEGKSRITINEVSRTPSLVVIRGTFDGLSVEEIQGLGRPELFLTDAAGKSVASESGRLGFGEGYRSFEMRFPAQNSGPATLELRGFKGGNVEVPAVTAPVTIP